MCRTQSNINPSLEKSLNKSIFKVKQKDYTWRDVLGFAEFVGVLGPHWDSLSDGIAVCRFAEAKDYVVEPSHLQTEANNLRYRFNLITAEETEEWLHSRELSLSSLNDFLNRDILTTHFSDQLSEIRDQIKIDSQIVLESLWSELILNDGYPHVVTPLIWRLMVDEFKLGEAVTVDDELAVVKKEFCQRESIDIGDLPTYIKSRWLLKNSFSNYLILEARYRKFYTERVPVEMANLLLKSLHHQLVRISYESVSFKDFEHAKEAFLCVTEDGCTLDHIAAQADGDYTKSARFVDAIPEDLRRNLMSAAVEEALPPRHGSEDEKFYIYRVLKKIEPQLDDPVVYSKVQQEYVKEILCPLGQAHVKWLKWALDLSHG